jgi:hypothetical protein
MLGIASTAILLDMPCPVDSQFLRVAGRAWLAKQPITNRKAKKMETANNSRICKECAETGRLKWLPCGTHHLVIPAELCGHENTSQIFIHNGEGLGCHDCGTQIGLITV